MSGHYNCGQFNDSFNARRLRNWQYGINNPGRYTQQRCSTTQFIADSNGHLLPHVTRNACSSPWGDYRGCIWEETTKCDCFDRIRNPQDYDRPPCSIVVTRERPRHLQEAKKTVNKLAQMLFKPPLEPEIQVKTINPGENPTPSTENLVKEIERECNDSNSKTNSNPNQTQLTDQHPLKSTNANEQDANPQRDGSQCYVFDIASGTYKTNVDLQIPA